MTKRVRQAERTLPAFDAQSIVEAIERSSGWIDGQCISLQTEIIRGTERETVLLKATMRTRSGQRILKLEY